MNLWKCSVCGFIAEGDNAPETCPKCGVPQDKFVKLEEDAANKVFSSDRTNDIHMEIINLAAAIVDLSQEGIELDLDPACVSVFEKAVDEAWVLKQRSKAELEGHMKKGKF